VCTLKSWPIGLTLILTLHGSVAAKQDIVFSPVRPNVCVRVSVCAITEKLMIGNWCHLVGICVMVPLRIVWFGDIWPSLFVFGNYFSTFRKFAVAHELRVLDNHLINCKCKQTMCSFIAQLNVAAFDLDLWPWNPFLNWVL